MSNEPLNGHLYTIPTRDSTGIFLQLVHEECMIFLFLRILSKKFTELRIFENLCYDSN